MNDRNKSILSKYFDLLYHDAYLYRKVIASLHQSPSTRINALLFLSYFRRYAISPEFDLKLKMLVKDAQDPIDQKRTLMEKLSETEKKQICFNELKQNWALNV